VLRERADLESRIEHFTGLQNLNSDVGLYLEMAEEGDDSALEELTRSLEACEKQLDEIELQQMLSGEYDRSNAIVEIRPGSGGTESQDWASMLMRMYTRWAERQGYKVEIIELHDGEEAGIKSATLKVNGHNAYGRLKTESGVHRLVRISPFDASARRHTTFASVFASPVIDDAIEVNIDAEDLRIDTYRSSGAGGQHVNKTDSAVRITHLPTNIVVSCQNERSQHQNKDRAMQMLAAKLLDLEPQKREDELAAISGESKRVGFGSQIRSYVRQPCRMVKDHRTSCEAGNVDGVLDGNLEPFIKAYLLWRR